MAHTYDDLKVFKNRYRDIGRYHQNFFVLISRGTQEKAENNKVERSSVFGS